MMMMMIIPNSLFTYYKRDKENNDNQSCLMARKFDWLIIIWLWGLPAGYFEEELFYYLFWLVKFVC
jgi:hypothetical protein